MKMTRKLTLTIVSLIACCASTTILGKHLPAKNTLVSPVVLNEFKIRPVARVWGITGSRSMGTGQVLFPIYGNQNQLLYGVAEGNRGFSHSKNWYAGGGLGYRQVVGNSIYGGYLIGSYNRSRATDHGYTIINPGLEFLGKDWDVTVNGYLPVGSDKINYSTTKWADQLGIFEYVQHIGRKKFNRMAQQDNTEFAGKGFDLKVGRVIPHFEKAKVYLGGYHFSNGDAGNITGGLVKATYDINKYAALELTQTYDGKNHSRTMMGVRLTLGGYDKQSVKDFGISGRLFDPIERGYEQTLVPIESKYGAPAAISPGQELELDNLWWFKLKPGAGAGTGAGIKADLVGDGTYENQFTDFNSDAVTVIKGSKYVPDPRFLYPRLMFNPGEYSLASFGGGTNTFSLPYGWGMYGMGKDDTKPAMGDERPLFRGTFSVDPTQTGDGNAGNNIIDSVIIKNVNGNNIFGIGLQDANDTPGNVPTAITLRNVQVGESAVAGGYITGIRVSNSTLNFDKLDYLDGGENSVYGYCTGGSCGATGIAISNGSTVNFVSGTNKVSALAASNDLDGFIVSYGITFDEAFVSNNVVELKGGKNTIEATANQSGTGSMFISASGIFVSAGVMNSSLIISGGENIIRGSIAFSGNANTKEVFGIDIASFGFSENSIIKFLGGKTTISANNTGAEDATSIYGIYTDDPTTQFYGANNTPLNTAAQVGGLSSLTFSHSGTAVPGGSAGVFWQGHDPQFPWPPGGTSVAVTQAHKEKKNYLDW